jgi:hypothetical protein
MHGPVDGFVIVPRLRVRDHFGRLSQRFRQPLFE